MAISRLCMPAVAALFATALSFAVPQAATDRAVEEKVVRYLRDNVKSGERVIVSDLYNNVFKSPEERKVLERLFNTFFKIPLYVAQFKASTGQIPTLDDIGHQFGFAVEGETSVILSILESDPRIPKFLTRDPKSGEITAVDVEAIRKDRRFGQALERTLAGWAGKDAPAFTLSLFDGKTLTSEDLKGRGYLLYFWFSGCPPCVRISPHLVELQRRFGPDRFTVVAVNADRSLEMQTTDDDRGAYVKKAGYNFPTGHLDKKIQADFGTVSVYPTLFLVDSSGMVRKQYVNYQTLETLAADVAAMLGR